MAKRTPKAPYPPGPWLGTCQTKGCGYTCETEREDIAPGQRCPSCYRVGSITYKHPKKLSPTTSASPKLKPDTQLVEGPPPAMDETGKWNAPETEADGGAS